jgi:hypothetical protein
VWLDASSLEFLSFKILDLISNLLWQSTFHLLLHKYQDRVQRESIIRQPLGSQTQNALRQTNVQNC